MKLRNLSKGLFLTLITITFAACSDDEKEPYYLNLGIDKCEIPVGKNSYISILSGNGDYTVKVGDDEIVEAVADFSAYPNMPFGVIRINAKQQGETTVSITDNVTQVTQTLKVKVTVDYVGFRITESDHKALSKERWAYLIDNDRKDVYFFEKENKGIRTLLAQGSYKFTVENSIPYLTLYYSESNGQFTEATIAPVAHKFNIKDNKTITFNFLKYMLQIDWDAMNGKDQTQDTRTSVIEPIYMKMKAEDTGQEITVLYEYTHIPEGILQE